MKQAQDTSRTARRLRLDSKEEADDFDSKILKGLLVLLYEKKEGPDLLR